MILWHDSDYIKGLVKLISAVIYQQDHMSLLGDAHTRYIEIYYKV